MGNTIQIKPNAVLNVNTQMISLETRQILIASAAVPHTGITEIGTVQALKLLPRQQFCKLKPHQDQV